MIFCRNVLMYLEQGCRRTVVERMAALLAPDGLLILDPVEHLGPAGQLFAPGSGRVVFGMEAQSQVDCVLQTKQAILMPSAQRFDLHSWVTMFPAFPKWAERAEKRACLPPVENANSPEWQHPNITHPS